jgi:DNA segregation ATPase FtsK/SpoIIIE-like protein
MLEGRVKKIEQWNNRFPRKKLSLWVLIIDELGDVMLQPGINRKVERKLVRIMQLGRAMGIRCVLATQTPKSEVITSLIQNNLTAWMVFRTGTGVASGLMLDGKYDAAKLPAIPGRAIFRQGVTMVEVQTPEITDLTIRKIVRMAKHGQLEQVSETQTIAPEQIFKYALSELSGYCSVSDIFKHFRKEGASKSELRQILQDYTVAGSPPALEPEIEINGEFYYLTPYITGSNHPRQLMKTDKFIAEFDRFAPYMGNGADTVHGSQSAENGDTPQAETAKIEETQEIVEVLPERGLFDE